MPCCICKATLNSFSMVSFGPNVSVVDFVANDMVL